MLCAVFAMPGRPEGSEKEREMQYYTMAISLYYARLPEMKICYEKSGEYSTIRNSLSVKRARQAKDDAMGRFS